MKEISKHQRFQSARLGIRPWTCDNGGISAPTSLQDISVPANMEGLAGVRSTPQTLARHYLLVALQNTLTLTVALTLLLLLPQSTPFSPSGRAGWGCQWGPLPIPLQHPFRRPQTAPGRGRTVRRRVRQDSGLAGHATDSNENDDKKRKAECS